MRFAVISDVHGNTRALDAVLADIAVAGADTTLCLGDHVSGPLDPAGAADRLIALDGPVIRGNHDRWLAAGSRDGQPLDRVDGFAGEQIAPEHRRWLAALPATATLGDEVFLCHGTPTSDDAPWLDNWYHDRRTTLPTEADVAALAQGYDFPVLLCGHTHLARSVRLRDGRLIVNPGAVGLQLIHGSPDARYAIVERVNGRWNSSIRVVAYDHDAAAQEAVGNGFPAWREALATGWTDPHGLF